MAFLRLLLVAAFLAEGGQAAGSHTFRGVHAGRFDGKVCLVTGGTSGIGEHAAHHLAREGCAVVITGRREEKGAKVVAELKRAQGKSKLEPSALFLKMDISDASQVEAGIAKINATYGRLDAVYANAGIGGMSTVSPVPESPLSDFHAVMATNVNGVFYTLRFSSALMLQAGPGKSSPGGAMVLCSSIFGQTSTSGTAAYIMSKHALEGLKKAAAQEFGTTIRVNNVGPGFTMSEMFEPAISTPFESWVLRHSAGGRLAEQSEVSSVIAWLLSDDASYVSAQSILVDGGHTSSFSPPSEQKRLADETAAAMAAAAAQSAQKSAEL